MGDSQLLRTGAQGRYRFDDLNTVFASGKESRGQQSLDRANVRLARGAWDIHLRASGIIAGLGYESLVRRTFFYRLICGSWILNTDPVLMPFGLNGHWGIYP